MLNTMRFAKMLLVLISIMGFFAFACRAETITAYSEQYTADLEQKQMLLESIRENSYQTESDIKEIGDKIKVIENKKMSHLEMESINLGQIMPPAEKITAAFPYMSSTLSPKTGARVSEQNKDKPRQ